MKISPNNLHISLDVWNTLVSANPQYSAARTQFLADHFNMSRETAAANYTMIKTSADDNARGFNQSVTPDQAIAMLIRTFTGSISTDADEISYIRQQFEFEFKRNPPLYDGHLVNELRALIDRGITVSIASNTNFIGGNTMERVVFDHWHVHFMFKLFSDREEMVKPDPRFFNRIRTLVPGNRDIIHIGDDLVCDITSTIHHKISSTLVDNPSGTLRVLKQISKQVR